MQYSSDDKALLVEIRVMVLYLESHIIVNYPYKYNNKNGKNLKKTNRTVKKNMHVKYKLTKAKKVIAERCEKWGNKNWYGILFSDILNIFSYQFPTQSDKSGIKYGGGLKQVSNLQIKIYKIYQIIMLRELAFAYIFIARSMIWATCILISEETIGMIETWLTNLYKNLNYRIIYLTTKLRSYIIFCILKFPVSSFVSVSVPSS